MLESLGISAEPVRGRVVAIVGEGEGEAVPAGQIPFTPRAKKVLELGLREGLSLGHDYIGTEHILLGIARENDGVAARILLDLGADDETIRDAVVRAVPEMSRQPRHAPWRRPRRPRRRFAALAMARDEALEDGNYDLARKLLELEIEERRKQAGSEDEPEAGSASA